MNATPTQFERDLHDALHREKANEETLRTYQVYGRSHWCGNYQPRCCPSPGYACKSPCEVEAAWARKVHELKSENAELKDKIALARKHIEEYRTQLFHTEYVHGRLWENRAKEDYSFIFFLVGVALGATLVYLLTLWT
jgi:hypothetical protein